MKNKLTIHHDFLEEALKADAAEYRHAYIDDAGFTLRVMDALPPLPSLSPLPRAQLSSQQRFAIIFGMASLAAIIATLSLSGGNLLIDASMDVATDTVTPAVVALFTIIAMTTVVSISAVLSRR